MELALLFLIIFLSKYLSASLCMCGWNLELYFTFCLPCQSASPCAGPQPWSLSRRSQDRNGGKSRRRFWQTLLIGRMSRWRMCGGWRRRSCWQRPRSQSRSTWKVWVSTFFPHRCWDAILCMHLYHKIDIAFFKRKKVLWWIFDRVGLCFVICTSLGYLDCEQRRMKNWSWKKRGHVSRSRCTVDPSSATTPSPCHCWLMMPAWIQKSTWMKMGQCPTRCWLFCSGEVMVQERFQKQMLVLLGELEEGWVVSQAGV